MEKLNFLKRLEYIKNIHLNNHDAVSRAVEIIHENELKNLRN